MLTWVFDLNVFAPGWPQSVAANHSSNVPWSNSLPLIKDISIVSRDDCSNGNLVISLYSLIDLLFRLALVNLIG